MKGEGTAGAVLVHTLLPAQDLEQWLRPVPAASLISCKNAVSIQDRNVFYAALFIAKCVEAQCQGNKSSYHKSNQIYPLGNVAAPYRNRLSGCEVAWRQGKSKGVSG
jgi:hypothetical protein